jgi:hypothetical protein
MRWHLPIEWAAEWVPTCTRVSVSGVERTVTNRATVSKTLLTEFPRLRRLQQ